MCYIHLDEVSQVVQQAVLEAGGLPFEIRTAAPSDFITSAGKKARYLMPTRDLIVNDIEVMVEERSSMGWCACPPATKLRPAITASARLNIPSIVVPCGYQTGGMCAGRHVDIDDVYESVGSVASGTMTLEELGEMTETAIQALGCALGLQRRTPCTCSPRRWHGAAGQRARPRGEREDVRFRPSGRRSNR